MARLINKFAANATLRTSGCYALSVSSFSALHHQCCPPSVSAAPGLTGVSPLPTIRQTVNANATQKATQKAKQRRKHITHLPNPVSQMTRSPRPDPPSHSHGAVLSTQVQHSWAALIFNKELGYLDLLFPLLGLPPDLCPQDGLLGFPLLAALEQMLARLLDSAVAPPTGVAGALADLLGPGEGVPRPELVEKREAPALLAFAAVGSSRILFRGRYAWCLVKRDSIHEHASTHFRSVIPRLRWARDVLLNS